jgi:uncharacterized protein YlxW (UPF0749 family)
MGIIGQYVLDNQEGKNYSYLGVTGEWSLTEKGAVASVKKAREKKLNSLRKRLNTLQETIKELEEASDTLKHVTWV